MRAAVLYSYSCLCLSCVWSAPAWAEDGGEATGNQVAVAADGAPTESSQPDYQQREVAGWQVWVSRQLLDEQSENTARALALMEGQLEQLVKLLPEGVVAELKKVPLWVSPEYAKVSPKAEYHPSGDWLKRNGRNPAMAKAVEFTNVRIFDRECKRMPMLVLHELAHAYHDRVLGNNHAGIKAAYERAKAAGSYDNVEQRFGDGRSKKVRAYAISNPQEYFAECSEAFWGVNDFYPFNRQELKELDPTMFALLEQLWQTNPQSSPE